jgi:hypothetical protein
VNTKVVAPVPQVTDAENPEIGKSYAVPGVKVKVLELIAGVEYLTVGVQ